MTGYHIHRSSHLDLILGQFNPLYTLTHSYFCVKLNILSLATEVCLHVYHQKFFVHSLCPCAWFVSHLYHLKNISQYVCKYLMQAKSAITVVVITFVVTNEMEHTLYITFKLFVGTSVIAVSNEAVYMRVGTLIVATIYLQLIQNRYMFRSFTVLQCSHQHCV